MVTGERRFEVIGVLGKGGFGTVYHARFLGEGGFTKEVALKVLNPEMENVAEVASRLRDEARVLGLIRHRAIVGVDRLTQIDGRWTVVMEYIEGRDVGALLAAGPMPVGVSLEITAEIAGALHAAWSRAGANGQPLRLLHRDLKPPNVRVTPFGEVKVLDFGIARAEFSEREAKTRSLTFGTPDYMSPERLDFAEDASAGDIYSLGAILFECLTGAPLGRTSANPNKHARRLAQATEALREAGVPEEVGALVLKMLQFEASGRPTAAEIERRAVAHARRFGSATLREWVDDLGDLFRATTPNSDSMTGSILVERTEPVPQGGQTTWERAPSQPTREPHLGQTPTPLVPAVTSVTPAGLQQPDAARSSESPAPLAPIPRPADKDRVPLVRAAGAVAFVALLGGLALWLAAGRDAHTERVASPLAPVVSGAEPAATPEAAASPPKSEGAVQVEQESASAAAEPRPATASAQAKARTTPTSVRVSLTGDATSAHLVSGARRVPLPGSAPPGNWQIAASFDGEPESAAGSVVLRENQPLTLHCDSQFGKCAPTGGAK